MKDKAEVQRELIRAQLGDQPYGHSRPSDAEFLAWWQMKLAENPPVPVKAPLEAAVKVVQALTKAGLPGTPVRVLNQQEVVMFVSLFLLALALATNSAEWLGRYRDAVRREQERLMRDMAMYAPPVAMEVA